MAPIIHNNAPITAAMNEEQPDPDEGLSLPALQTEVSAPFELVNEREYLVFETQISKTCYTNIYCRVFLRFLSLALHNHVSGA
jgi:hypothetical protein